MSSGACDLAVSDTARSREDGMEGLPLTTPSQKPCPRSLVVTGICYHLGMLLAPTASPALYTGPLTPSLVRWAAYFQSAELWLGWTILLLGVLVEKLRWHPVFL